MPHGTHDLRQHRFKKTDKLFLDTNAWVLLLSAPRPGDERVEIYQQAYNRMNEAQSQIYVDPIVLSEFANARLKDARKGSEAQFPRPKDFRHSPDFKAAAMQIAGDVRKILARCHYIERGITPQSIEAFLPAYTEGKMDFNDHLIAQLCIANGLTLATNDGDFAHHNINLSIITDNRQLLKARK